MMITFFSIAMSILWSSFLMLIFSLLRKNYKLLDICSVSGIVILYVFCAVRLLIPVELPWVYIVKSKHVYNAFYTFIMQPVFDTKILVWQLFTCVWIIGTLISLTHLIYRYVSCYHRLKVYCKNVNTIDASEYGISDSTITVVKTSMVNVPISIGIFKKYILIPVCSYTDKEMKMIINHEYTHLINHDLVVQLLINILCAIYWWNPIAYLLKNDLEQYFEIRCDAYVTRKMTNNQIADYLELILKIYKNEVGIGRELSGLTILGTKDKSGGKLKERFEILSKGKDKHARHFGKIAALFFSAFVLLLSYSFIIQSCFSAPKNDITGNGSIAIEPDNSYLIRHSDGTYTIHSGDTQAKIKEEDVEQLRENGFKIYSEGKH